MEEREIKIKVNTGDSSKQLDNVANSAHHLSDELQNVQEEITPLTTIMGEMEDRLMLMAHAGDTTSEEFQKLSLEVAGMRKTIRETDMGIEALSMTTSQKLGGALGGVTAGFETVQGVMGSFGVSGEAVEKAMLKVQSAMAISQGIQGIKESLPAFKAMGSAAKDAFSSMSAGAKAFAATGIGLIITAVAVVAANFDKIKSAISGVSAQQNKLNALVAKDLKSQQDKLEAVTSQDAQLKMQGYTEKQILQMKLKQTNETIRAMEISMEQSYATAKMQYETAKRGKEILKGIIEFVQAPLFLILKSIDKVAGWVGQQTNLAKGLSDWTASLIYDPTEVRENFQKDYEEQKKQLNSLKEQRANFQLEIQNIDNDAAQKARDNAQAAASDAAASKEEALNAIKEAEKEYQDSLLTEQEKEINAVNEKYNKLIADAQKYGQDTTQLEEAQKNALNDINVKYALQEIANQDAKNKALYDQQVADNEKRIALEDQQFALEQEVKYKRIEETLGADAAAKEREKDQLIKSYEDKFAVAGNNHELEKQLSESQQTELANIDKKYADQAKARQKQLNQQRLDGAKTAFGQLGDLAQAFGNKSKKQQKQAFNIQKAANIASATIDTYKAAESAFASAANPILGAVFMAIAIAAGIANIVKISKTKFDENAAASGGGGGTVDAGGGGGGGTASAMTPQFNIVGSSPINQLANISTQPVRAYVVSGEVSSAQSLDRNRQQNATL